MASERRRFPRIPADMALEVHFGDGDVVRAVVRNLSRSGLEMSCDRWVADRLLPPGHQAFPGQPIEVRLAFQLSGEDGTGRDIQVAAQIIESRRLAQNEFRVGIQFTAFEGDGAARVEQFIERG